MWKKTTGWPRMYRPFLDMWWLSCTTVHTGNQVNREQNNVAFRQLLPWPAYPVLFCIHTTADSSRVRFCIISTEQGSSHVFSHLRTSLEFIRWNDSNRAIGAMKLSKSMRIFLSRAKDSTLTNERTSESIPRDISRLLGTMQQGWHQKLNVLKHP